MSITRNRRLIRYLGYTSLIVTLIFIIAMSVCTVISAGQLEIMLPEGNRAEDFRPENDIVQVSHDPGNERRMIVNANGRGRVFINNESPEPMSSFVYVKVLPGGIVYDMSTGNFSGYRQLTVIVQIYVFMITLLLTLSFILRCRTELFTYSTLFCGGAALFLASIMITMLTAHTADFTMPSVYSALKNAGYSLTIYSLPLMAVFAVSLTVSNIALIKREGKSFVNVLGLIMSVLIIGGYVFSFFLDRLFFSGSERQMRIYNTLFCIYYTAFAYFEMMLVSASLCGMIAARKKPAPDKTHVIILGCAIAQDGTPLPLLRGRIDRAIAFAKEQQDKGGGEIKFVPSGGKGSDEVISEAESMKNYLLTQGIDESRVILENKSANTQENMRFSLEKIKADCAEPRIVFSTSGYHVLRSGMISEAQGLNAEGIGCRTKWYFWPNAFIREFIGLLASKWRRHMFWMIFFIVVFSIINMIAPM